MNIRNIIPILAILTLCACHKEEKKFRVGVSQCSDDIWRDKQNQELQTADFFHDDLELCFVKANDNSEQQIHQIDSLVDSGIDLLIVAPNQTAVVTPAIDRAYDKGIPVIVFERKTNSKKYTAFIGADNREMGSIMGDYVVNRLQGKGRVMVVMGLKGSSPATERHNGFREALQGEPGISIVATLQGDWTQGTAYNKVKEWLSKHPTESIDLVFGMNDRTAMGARQAFEEHGGPMPLFCGVDGLPGEKGGIAHVRDSLLDATFIYPTHGEKLLQLADDILHGRPYEKETTLSSAIVTAGKADVLLMESEEVVREAENLQRLHEKISEYMQELTSQRMFIILAVVIIILLLLLSAIVYVYLLQKAHMAEERQQMERERLDFYTRVSHELRTPLTLIHGPLEELAATPDKQNVAPRTLELFGILRRNTNQLTMIISKMLDAQVGKDIKVIAEEAQQEMSDMAEPVAEIPKQEIDVEQTTVLIIDDNADLRVYLRSILQDHYTVIEAADGEEGLKVAHEQIPDIIVSDVMMPVMNGLEFCQHVKTDSLTSHVPVILLTARALSQHQIEGYRCGADAYLTKPFDKEVLLARIDNLLKGRHYLRNLWDRQTEENKTAQQERHEENAAEDEKPKPKLTTLPSPDSDPFLRQLKDVIDQHMSETDLSVEDIGKEMLLSRVQLYRKVKALTGTTPVDLIRKARLAKAHTLLTDSMLSISEIAYQTGFTSPSYFNKCFRDEYGIAPGDLRK